MKRRIISLLLILTLTVSFVVVASAATNAVRVTPSLSFTGTTANCEATVRQSGASISATMELKHGSTVIATWTASGTAKVTMSETATVTSGQTYTLTVSGTVNGNAFTPVSVTKTCP